MPSKKLLGALGLSAALVGGGAAGALLYTPAISIAQTDDSSTTTAPDESETPSTPDESGDEGNDCGPFGRGGFFVDLDVAAEALGLTADELRDELADGTTIAEVAEAEGVDVQTVIDALVAAATAEIDEAVADLDADDAEELEADLADRLAEFVNEGHRGPGWGGPGRWHRGPGPDDD
ncbi:MAG: hypothetical protein ACRD29_23060 [Acidimicrobiales bacterium]